jgi:hypothetical protein
LPPRPPVAGADPAVALSLLYDALRASGDAALATGIAKASPLDLPWNDAAALGYALKIRNELRTLQDFCERILRDAPL